MEQEEKALAIQFAFNRDAKKDAIYLAEAALAAMGAQPTSVKELLTRGNYRQAVSSFINEHWSSPVEIVAFTLPDRQPESEMIKMAQRLYDGNSAIFACGLISTNNGGVCSYNVCSVDHINPDKPRISPVFI